MFFLRHQQPLSESSVFSENIKVIFRGRQRELVCFNMKIWLNQCNQYKSLFSVNFTFTHIWWGHPETPPLHSSSFFPSPSYASLSSQGLQNELEQLFRGLKTDGTTVWINRKCWTFKIKACKDITNAIRSLCHLGSWLVITGLAWMPVCVSPLSF